MKVDRFFPSSKICNECGVKSDLTTDLTVRKGECPNCGAKSDRDVNAAVNLLNEGLKMLKEIES